jgi:putative addiction module component (TIGR02574 family)
MNAQVDQLLDEALLLPAADRSALVAVLLDSLDGSDDASIPDAWRAEIARRRAALRDGSISPVPWAEARARLTRL